MTVLTLTEVVAEWVRRYRLLWGGFCWGIALLFTGFGTAYAIFGTGATSLPASFVALTGALPGGLHTYGGLLLFFGVLLIEGLANAWHKGGNMRDGYLHIVLPIVAAAAFSAAGMFALSWAMSGVKTWAGVSYWSGAGFFSLLLWKLPPYASGSGRVA